MTDILINLAGIFLVALIVWWFWLSAPVAKKYQDQIIDILVKDGVYTPARIEIPRDQKITLRFRREDASPCAEKVLFATLDKNLELPLHQPVDIELTFKEPGEYAFTCEMQMYRGSLLVKDSN